MDGQTNGSLSEHMKTYEEPFMAEGSGSKRLGQGQKQTSSK